MIYLIDLEYVETRYTAQWKTEFPQAIADKTDQAVTVIEGPPDVAGGTTPGSVIRFSSAGPLSAPSTIGSGTWLRLGRTINPSSPQVNQHTLFRRQS